MKAKSPASGRSAVAACAATPETGQGAHENTGTLLGAVAGGLLGSQFGGGTGELCYLDGAFIPFAKTRAEREATKDPRLSLAERYRDNADYSERVKAAATALERDGYLLPEDTKRIVERAAKLTW